MRKLVREFCDWPSSELSSQTVTNSSISCDMDDMALMPNCLVVRLLRLSCFSEWNALPCFYHSEFNFVYCVHSMKIHLQLQIVEFQNSCKLHKYKANNIALEFMFLGSTFMYTRSSEGPITVPWGTPDVTYQTSESSCSVFTTCCRSLRNSRGHQTTLLSFQYSK